MKKFLVTILFSAAVVGYAQNTVLFEISGKGSTSKSYLMGTIHSGSEEVYGFNDSIFSAINATSKAAFELDMGEDMLKRDFRPSREVLEEWKDYAEKEIAPEIEKLIEADTLAERILTLVENSYATVFDMLKNVNLGDVVVDKFLQDYARETGKKIIGIETVSEQFDAMLKTDKALVKKAIVNFIKKDNWDIDIEAMMGGENGLIKAYSERNLDELCRLVTDGSEKSSNKIVQSVYKHLLEERNTIMLNRTLPLLEEGSVFIAVGAGHLCGTSGLINQYRKAGYTLRPVDVSSHSKMEVSWKTFEEEDYKVDMPDQMVPYQNGMVSGWTTMNYYTGDGKVTFSAVAESFDYSAEWKDVMDQYDVEEMIEAGEAAEAVQEFDYEDVETVEDVAEGMVHEEAEYADEAYEATEVMEEETEEAGELMSAPDDDIVTEELEEEVVEEQFEVVGPGYWEIVGDKVREGMSDVIMSSVMQGRDFMSAEGWTVYPPSADSLSFTILGQEETLVLRREVMSSIVSLNYEKLVGNKQRYELTVKGNEEFLKSDDVKHFFESFELK